MGSHENIIIMDRYRSIFILALFATIVNQSLQFSFDRPHPYVPFTLIRTKDVMEDPKVKETATALQRATEILQEIIDHANMLDKMKRKLEDSIYQKEEFPGQKYKFRIY